MHTYVPISEASLMPLKAVIAQLEADPKLLDHPSCPYTDGVKQFLRAHFTEKGAIDNIFELGEDKFTVIERQLETTITELEEHGRTIGPRDSSDKLAYFKTKTSLIEKLVGLQERAYNLKEMSDFQTIMLTFLEEICNKDQVQTLKERLRSLKFVRD